MSTNRTLWVDDAYAPRCRRCNARFTVLRRRHHCRQCGQVFCGHCLVQSPLSIGSALVHSVTDWIGAAHTPREGSPVKMCRHCATMLARSPPTRHAATAERVASFCPAREVRPGSSSAPRADTSEADVVDPSQNTPLSFSPTRPTTAAAEYDPDTCYTALSHNETAEERAIAYCIAQLPPPPPPSFVLPRCHTPHRTRSVGHDASPGTPTSALPTPSSPVVREVEVAAGAEQEWWDEQCRAHLHEQLRRWLHRAQDDAMVMADDTETLLRRLGEVAYDVVRQVAVPLGSHVGHHVHVLELAGECEVVEVVDGVAIPHGVTSRRMRTHVSHPRLLVLAGEVASPVVPGEDVLEYVTSGRGHLDKLFERIKAWRPDVIVVEKGMHHYLQRCIVEEGGMTLLLHVGEAYMRWLALGCGAAIVADLQYVSLDEIHHAAVLGTCARFDVVGYKTPDDVGDGHVCVFRGLPCPIYVTVLLRAPSPELRRVLARLVRAGVVLAQHLAAQRHLLYDLDLNLPPCATTTNAGATMNLGVQCPAGQPARDECGLYVNTILLDKLYHDGVVKDGVGGGRMDGVMVDAAVTPVPYRVRQSRTYMRCYGARDESLLSFLSARSAQAGSQLLLVHGPCRVHVTTRAAPSSHVDPTLRDVVPATPAQQQRWSTSQQYARQLRHYRALHTAAGEEGGVWGPQIIDLQRMQGLYAGCDNNMAAGSEWVSGALRLCSPDALNVSFVAFLEFAIYGLPHCRVAHAVRTLGLPCRVRFVLQPGTETEVEVCLCVSAITVSRLDLPSCHAVQDSAPASPTAPAATASRRDVDALYLSSEQDDVLSYVQRVVEAVPDATAELRARVDALRAAVRAARHRDEVAQLCWRELRPLVQELRGKDATVSLATPQWWYSVRAAQLVRLHDVGSLIALALSCARVTALAEDMPTLRLPRSCVTVAPHTSRSSSAATTSDDATSHTPHPIPTPTPPHPKYTFTDLVSATGGCEDGQRPVVEIEVVCANEFAALQARYTRGHVDHLIAALRRTRPFHAEGGKTRADFCISEDGRYLLKRIKATELRHFGKMSTSYFRHLAESSDDDAGGSVLGTVLGLYVVRVQAASQQRANETPLVGLPPTSEPYYYVLMEYLFYHCAVDAIYDLKGSQRNRTTGDGALVRLDVDLVQQLRQGHFLFSTEEDKARLMRLLRRDVDMLTGAAVMDYSLVVGLDTTGCRIRVGVIDYLHPYSSAKVIESKVKSGLDTVLGHAAHCPTIISPEHYGRRFLEWIDGYFCAVPDKFTLE